MEGRGGMEMLTSFALIFLGGLASGALCRRLQLPGLVGMLLTGMLLGPSGLNLLDPSVLGISADLRELALIIILARAGLSLDLSDLRQLGRPAVLMSFVPACFEMAATLFLAPRLFPLTRMEAAILAAVVASASPAVIVPRMIRLMETGYGTGKGIPQLILAADAVDDLFNILVFTALLGLNEGEGFSPLRFAELPLSVVLGVLVGAAAGYGLALLFRKARIRDSRKLIIFLSVAFLLVSLEEAVKTVVPYAGLLAVMAAGVVLLKALPAGARRLSVKCEKLWVAAELLLFALVGAGVDVRDAAPAGLKTAGLLVFVLAVRGLGILLCLVKTKLNGRERLFCVCTGIPKATVQAAIGGIPLAMGLPKGEIILAVAVFSILFTAPLGAFVLDRSYRHLLAKEPEGKASEARI